MAKELKKASFVRRLAAFIIDMVLVAFVAGLISTPFVNINKLEQINKKESELVEKYKSQKITPQEYVDGFSDVYYESIKANGINSFIEIILAILYFVVLQLYNKGQTLGKKMLKIKVISENDDLSMNQMILRSLLSNFILVNILGFAFLTFASKHVYIMSVGTIQMINYLIVFISVIMATLKEGRTIHDRIAHTRVVKVN